VTLIKDESAPGSAWRHRQAGNGRIRHMLVKAAGPIATGPGWGEEALEIGAGTEQDPRDSMESAVTLGPPGIGFEPAQQEDEARPRTVPDQSRRIR